MVQAGEGSGRLEEALDRVAAQLEKLDALRRQVKSAMMYPAIVFTLALVVMVVVVAFIVPVFVGIFEEISAENPAQSADAAAHDPDHGRGLELRHPLLVHPAPGHRRRWRTRSCAGRRPSAGASQWDRLKLRIPMKIGDVVQKVALARWSRTFSGTVSSGVPILQAIQISGETSGNAVIEEAMEDVYDSVKQGGTIAKPLGATTSVFPPMVSHMVSVGEEIGSARADAGEDRRLLRGRGRREDQGAHVADRAGDDHLRRRRRRLHRDLDVPADLQPLRQDPVADPRAPPSTRESAASGFVWDPSEAHEVSACRLNWPVGACALIAGLGASFDRGRAGVGHARVVGARFAASVGRPADEGHPAERDIALRACFLGDPIRESPLPVDVDGNGHTVRQTCFEKRVLRQDGTGFLASRTSALTRRQRRPRGGDHH